MFAVVEEQHRPAGAEVIPHLGGDVATRKPRDAQSVCDGSGNQRRVDDRGERHQPNAVLPLTRQPASELGRQPALADTAGTNDGQRRPRDDEFGDAEQLLLAADEAVERHDDVVTIGRHRPQRGETGGQTGADRSEELDRGIEVPQPVGAQRPELDVVDRTRDPGGLGRDDDLTAVPSRNDARSLVDGEGDVLASSRVRQA